MESVEKNAKKFANKKVTGKRSVQNWGLYKRHEYNVKQHDCYVKRHDYTVKRHDYTVKRHNYTVKQYDYNVKWYDYNVRVILRTFSSKKLFFINVSKNKSLKICNRMKQI